MKIIFKNQFDWKHLKTMNVVHVPNSLFSFSLFQKEKKANPKNSYLLLFYEVIANLQHFLLS